MGPAPNADSGLVGPGRGLNFSFLTSSKGKVLPDSSKALNILPNTSWVSAGGGGKVEESRVH